MSIDIETTSDGERCVECGTEVQIITTYVPETESHEAREYTSCWCPVCAEMVEYDGRPIENVYFEMEQDGIKHAHVNEFYSEEEKRSEQEDNSEIIMTCGDED